MAPSRFISKSIPVFAAPFWPASGRPGPPVATLYGMEQQERVIYVGTFSKVMFPSLRLGYMVLPRALVPAMCAVRYGMDICPPFLSQRVMTRLLRDGHFALHIRRTPLAYRERRQALIETLGPFLRPELVLRGAAARLHVSLLLPDCDDVRIAQAAAAEKIMALAVMDPGQGNYHDDNHHVN